MEKAEIKPAVVQVEAHPYYPQAELKSYLDTFGAKIMAWYPLGHGDMAGKCLCMDVGGSSIEYALIDETLSLTDQGKVPTPYGSLEEYLSALEGIWKQFCGQAEGIALSVPGVIDSENGVCVTAGALDRFAHGLELVRELETRCGVPVTIMNDAKCAALAEAAWGALSDCRDGIVLVLGTGIGGALIKTGEVHMGAHFAADEFSTVSVDERLDSDESMWYGLNGSHALIRKTAYVKGVAPESINGEDVFRWANAGDPDVLRVLDRFTAATAVMLRNLQLIFDPERIAIGGGISRQPLLLEYIQRNLDYINRLAARHGMPKPQVTTCRFFNEANLVGAYAYFRQVKR